MGDDDFLPKDIWTYIHTPITQGFYGFGWMIDNSNAETGAILQHGGTDGHNFAQAITVPRFQIGLNIGTNNGGGLSESRQSAGFQKIISNPAPVVVSKTNAPDSPQMILHPN